MGLKLLQLRKLIRQMEICDKKPLMELDNKILEEALKESSALFELKECGAKVLYLYYGAWEEAKDKIIQKLDKENTEEVKDAFDRINFLKEKLDETKNDILWGIVYTTASSDETQF